MCAIVEWVNAWGEAFGASAGAMLIQSSVVIAVVLLLDQALRRWVRAVFRYWLWLLILVKLVLPPTLSTPYSAGSWLASGIDRITPLLNQAMPEPPAGETATSRERKDFDPQAYDALVLDTTALVSPWQESEAIVMEESAPATENQSIPAIRAESYSRPQYEMTPDTAGAATVSLKGMLFLLWAIVCAAMTLLVVQHTYVMHKLVAQSTEADAALRRLLQSCRTLMQMRADVDIRISSALSTPAVYGIFRPVILVPSQVRKEMTRDELEIIVVHELVHIRRGDLSIKLLQTILQVVYFYNPLLWVANAMIRRIREQAVDETVLVTLGPRAITQYPRALVQVAGLAFGRAGMGLRLIGVVESKGLLTERIRIMLHKPIPTSAKLSVFGAIVLALLAVLLLPMARAEEKPAASSNSAAEEGVPSQAGASGPHEVVVHEGNIVVSTPVDKIAARHARMVVTPDGKTATIHLVGSTVSAPGTSGEGNDLQALQEQIAQLRKELDERMEMLKLLEGKLKVAQLEMRVKERISADADAERVAVVRKHAMTAQDAAAAARDEAVAAQEKAAVEHIKSMEAVSHSTNVPGAPPHVALSFSGPDHVQATQPGQTPPTAAAAPKHSRRIAMTDISDGPARDVSAEVRQAVQEVLPQVLEEMLPKLIEEVLAKLEHTSAARP